ncbi:unnamed protein product [Symbiodinium sp. CCMP2592]|nr:unnamed protein product [Symbiodinium sp. CCMP2592]
MTGTVPYLEDGPFSIRQGNAWLEKLRKSIRPSSWNDLLQKPGKYILAYEHHFVSARHQEDEVLINMGGRTHEFESFQLKRQDRAVRRHPATGKLCVDNTRLDHVFELVDHVEPALVADYSGGKLVQEAAVDFEEVWNQLQLQRQEMDGVILRHPQPQHIANDRNPDLVEAAADFEEAWNELQLQRQETDGVILRYPQPQRIANDHNPDLVSNSDSEEDGFWDLRPDWLERFRARRQQSENREMLQQNELVHRQAYSLLPVRRVMTTNNVPFEQFASSSSISRRRITMEYFGGVLPGLVDGQQLDYAGGSWISDEPYPSALDFFNSQTDFFQHEADKHVAVVVKVMREHLDLLRTSPLAVAFLPDPRFRNSISKRLWERIMYRARAILDFVEQKQHYMLFAFLHAEAKHVKAGCRNAVQDLPHPKEYGGTEEEWRTLALEHALQLHLDLAWQQKERGDFKKASRSEDDYTGGSLSADILHALPGFFFSFDYLKNLACASSEMKRAVQNPQHWNDRCISLNSVEFTDGLKLRSMTRAYMSARTVSLDLQQLPLLGQFPNSMLLEWTGRGLPQLRNLKGFESAGPLLGTALFDVILPPNAVGMYIGVRDWGDRSQGKQSFFRFDNVYTDSQRLSFASGDQPPQLHHKPQRVPLQPERHHRVLLRWKQDVMELLIDGVGVTSRVDMRCKVEEYEGGAVLDELLAELPGFYFSFDYLKMLASTSKTMLRAVRDRRHWQGKLVTMNTEEFQLPMKLRWMMEAYMSAHVVTINVRQLTMFTVFPHNMLLDWSATGMLGGPRPAVGPNMTGTGFQSTGPLMGNAVFDIILPPNTVGIYIGVRDWCDLRSRTHAYCMFTNIFENARASFGLGDHPSQPHLSARTIRFQPDHTHRIIFRWNPRTFQISLDGVNIATARAREGASAAPCALAKLFVWVYGRPTRNFVLLQYRPIPSLVDNNATIKCVLCNRDHGLHLPRWCVCPHCDTWVCSVHAVHFPERLCPRCPNQLIDYVGGSTETEEPFRHAVDYVYSREQKLQNGMTFTAWLRLSFQRSEAIRRQEKKRRADGRQVQQTLFQRQWLSGLSPACCPTYGPRTSNIRIPIEVCNRASSLLLLSVPADFTHLPNVQPDCSLLCGLQKHERDNRIQFVSETHVYYVDGVAMKTSVTGLVHRFAERFDADAAIANMAKSARWPRPEYSRAQDNGVLIPLTPDEIKKMWARNAAEAAHQGTWMHLQIEVLLNGGFVAGVWPELTLFEQFVREFPCPSLAFRTEWCIFAEEHRLAGCIDFVAKSFDDSLVLFDWKRTKMLHSKYDNPWRRMQGPLGHLPDCAGWHYRLQLNLYKHILERYYGYTVSAMYVVCLHPDNANTGPFLDLVPNLTNEVSAMLAAYGNTSDLHWQEVSGGADPAEGMASQSSFFAAIDADIAEAERVLDEEELAANAPNPAVEAADPSLDVEAANEQEAMDCTALAIPCRGLPMEAVESAKRRRLMPGASTSSSAFDELFDITKQACRNSLASCPDADDQQPATTVKEHAIRLLGYVRRKQSTGQRTWFVWQPLQSVSTELA